MKRNNANIAKKLSRLAKKTVEAVFSEMEKIANEGANVAREVIIKGASNTDFTQKYGSSLADYITVSREGNKFVITAGENAPEDVRYNLYYAEYGAGIYTSSRRNTTSSGYILKGRANKFGWKYKTLQGEYVRVKGSIALEYMWQARRYMKDQMGKPLRDRFKTAIARVWRKE